MSALHASGGGRLVAFACVDGRGAVLMPCGRCRQLLWEHGGPDLLVDTVDGPEPMTAILPRAFDAGESGMSEPFDAVDVIIAKRDGHRLTDAQIDWVIDAYTRGAVADEQMSALAMAVLLRGMEPAELGPLDGRHDQHRGSDWTCPASAGRPPTSTRPAASATRSPCRSRRSSRRAAPPSRSCPAAASATPAARWTSWSPSRAGGLRCPTPSSWPSSSRSARWSARPEPSWHRPTASSTRCAT